MKEIAGRIKNQENTGSFLNFKFYIMYLLLGYKKPHKGLAIMKAKPKIKSIQTKEISYATLLQRESVLGPGLHTSTNIPKVNVRKPSHNEQRTNAQVLKTNLVNLSLLR